MMNQKMVKLLMVTVLFSQISFNSNIFGMEDLPKVTKKKHSICCSNFWGSFLGMFYKKHDELPSFQLEYLKLMISQITKPEFIYKFLKTSKKFTTDGVNRLSKEQIQALKNCVIKLDLSDSNINDDKLINLIQEFPNTQELNLTNCRNITDRALTHLIKLQKLSNLSICGCCNNITEEGLKNLGKIKNLETLNLLNFSNITASLGYIVTRLKQLQNLNLSSCYGLTIEDLELLKLLPNLQSLTLEGLNFNQQDVQKILRSLLVERALKIIYN